MARSRSKNRLTEQQLAGYRQWLRELNEEMEDAGGDPDGCDEELWEYFAPRSSTGRQIYESFSDDELLDLLIGTMDHPGHRPLYDKLHYISRQYIQTRFSGMNNAKNLAKRRMKRMADQRRWPANWPERVSPRPLLEWMERRGRPVGAKDLLLLESICERARRERQPPELSSVERSCLDHLCGCKQALEQMGIPSLNRTAKKHMQQYWAQQRRMEQLAALTAAKQEEVIK